MAFQSSYPRKFSALNANPGVGTDATAVAAVAGKRIRVTHLIIAGSAAGVVTVKSGANTIGFIPTPTAVPIDLAGSVDDPLFETNAGEALIVNPDAAITMRGFITYVLV